MLRLMKAPASIGFLWGENFLESSNRGVGGVELGRPDMKVPVPKLHRASLA